MKCARFIIRVLFLMVTAAPILSAANNPDVGIKLLSNSLLRFRDGKGAEVYVNISPPLKYGESRKISFSVKRDLFSTDSYVVSVVGENPSCAELLVSEFTTKGNKNRQDRVELFATKGGSLDGICVFYGDSVLKLPDISVATGAFADFELPDGLSQNRGFLEVRASSSPAARIMDKVVYSPPESGDQSSEGWIGAGADASLGTVTRSLNRRFDESGKPVDTDTAGDFYVTVTRGATFGKQNNPKVYVTDH